jgi:hypothetical protein
MTFCKNSIIVLALLFVSACSFRPGGNTSPSGSTLDSNLEVDPITTVSVANKAANEYGFISERSYHLRTCLHDKLNNQRQWGVQKIVLNGNEFHFETTTDSQGCFEWNEKLGPYRHLAREHYIAIERELNMLGRKLKFSFAINPWPEKEVSPSVLSELAAIPEAKKADALLGMGEFAKDAFLAESGGSNLKVMSPKIELLPKHHEQGKGRHFDLKAYFSLEGWRYRYDGKPAFEKLTKGPFNVTLVLNENQLKVGPVTFDSIERLVVEGDVVLPEHFDVQKQTYDVEYEIASVRQDVGILPALGFIQIKPSGNGGFTGGDIHSVKPKKVISPPPVPAPVASTPEDDAPFLVEQRWITRGPDVDFDSKQWIKTILVHSKVCPQQNSNPPAQLRKMNFKVELSDSTGFSSNAEVFPLDPSGCVEWNQKVSYPIRGPEKNASGKIEIPSKYLIVQGMTFPYAKTAPQVREFQLNLWENDLAWDVSVQKGKLPEYNGTSSAQLSYGQASYVARGARFEVDKYLQLYRHFHFDVTLNPQLFRDFRYRNSPTSGTSGVEKDFQLPPNSEFEVEGVLAGRSIAAPTKIGDPSMTPLASRYLAHFVSKGVVDSLGQLQIPVMLPFLFTETFRLKAHTKLYLRVRSTTVTGLEKTFGVNFYVPLAARDLTKNLRIEEGVEITSAFDKVWADAKASTSRAIVFKDGTAYAKEEIWPSAPVDPTLAVSDQNPLAAISPLEMAIRLFKNGDEVIRVSLDGTIKTGGWALTLRDTALSHAKITDDQVKPLAEQALKVDNDQTRANELFPVLRPLCPILLGTKNSLLDECNQKPDVFFEASRFVVMTEDPIVELDRVDFNLELAFNSIWSRPFSMGDRHHDGNKHSDVSEEISRAGNVGVSGPMGGGHIGNARKFEDELFLTKETLWNADYRAEVGVSATRNVWSGQSVTLRLTGNRQQCLLIRPVGYLKSFVRKVSLVFCEQVSQGKFLETWYEFDEKTPTIEVLLANPANLEERGFSKIIRGEGSYEEYKLRVGHNTVAYVSEPIEAFLSGAQHPQKAETISIDNISRLFADGGMGPGITTRNIMRPKFRWAKKEGDEKKKAQFEQAEKTQFDQLLAKCVLGKESDRKEPLSVAYLVQRTQSCRCFYETASQRWTFEEMNKDYDQLKPQIDEIEAYCFK